MKRSFYIILLCYFTVFCSKQQLEPVDINSNQFPDLKLSTNFLIKKGNHYCEQNQIQIMNRNTLAASVTFGSSAIYTSGTAENQGDINKLIGFSDCSDDHQQNSARLGWSWNGEHLVLHAYVYTDKIRISKAMGFKELDKPIYCSIKAENNFYYFKVDDHIDSIQRSCSAYNGSRYKLFPYFGGDETAPHDIKILIEEQ